VVMVGLMGGYVRSDIDFEDRDSGADFAGYNLGGYMTYLSGRFFTDLLLKADILDVDYVSGIPGIERDDDDVRSYGVRLDSGYRFGSSGFFVDPQATLEYVYTELEDAELAGTAVTASGRTLKGRLGVRVGTTMNLGGSRLEASIMPSVWHLIDDDSDVDFANAGPRFRLTDQRDRTYGEVSGIVNLLGGGNVSGFLKADYRFSGELKGYGLRGGLRIAL